MDVVVYEKPTCSTCRLAMQALRDMGVKFDSVNYYEEPLSEAKLKNLLKKMGISAQELLRTRESIYKKLGLAEKLTRNELTDGDLVKLMVKYPDLMQRPIIEKGDRAVLARPVENLKRLV